MPRTTVSPSRGPRLPRLRTGVGVVLLAVAAVVATPASASLTGYGPVGPDPASQLGLSVPVVAAEVGGPSGSVVVADLPGVGITVTRPAGYSSGSQVVSVTDLSGDGVAEALLPADALEGSEVVLALGVGVRPVETAEAGTGVQGRASRALAPEATAAGTSTAAARSDALTVEVRSPELVGATVVVVGERTETSVSSGAEMTLVLEGPAAVFALRPVAVAVADTGVPPVAPSTSDEASSQPSPPDADAAGAPADAQGGVGWSTAAWVAGLVLLAALGAAALVLGRRPRGSRRAARR